MQAHLSDWVQELSSLDIVGGGPFFRVSEFGRLQVGDQAKFAQFGRANKTSS